MGRLFTPFQQFFDRNGNPLDSGTLQFLMSGTDVEQDTYSDAALNNLNTNPVVLDGEGRVPNVFGDGVYTVVLKNKNGVLIDRLNEVGGDPGSRTAFSDWTTSIIYNVPAIVVGSNGLYYENLSNGNLGNDPVSSPQFWSEIRFMDVWSQFVTYSTGEVVQLSSGELYRSLVDNNLNNPPETDDGTNWLPAVNTANVLVPTNTVIPKTGGGTLDALRINELQDAMTYNIPLANTVSANQTIIVTQPLQFADNEPTVQRSGTDVIQINGSTDTDILFDQTGSRDIRLTSNGVDTWRLTV